jgi:hypothetical protein
LLYVSLHLLLLVLSLTKLIYQAGEGEVGEGVDGDDESAEDHSGEDRDTPEKVIRKAEERVGKKFVDEVQSQFTVASSTSPT